MPFISRLALLLLYYTNWAPDLQSLIYFHSLWRVKKNHINVKGKGKQCRSIKREEEHLIQREYKCTQNPFLPHFFPETFHYNQIFSSLFHDLNKNTGHKKEKELKMGTMSKKQIIRNKSCLQKWTQNFWHQKGKNRGKNSVLNKKKWKKKDGSRCYKPARLPSMQVPNDLQLAELLGKIKSGICYWAQST